MKIIQNNTREKEHFQDTNTKNTCFQFRFYVCRDKKKKERQKKESFHNNVVKIIKKNKPIVTLYIVTI